MHFVISEGFGPSRPPPSAGPRATVGGAPSAGPRRRDPVQKGIQTPTPREAVLKTVRVPPYRFELGLRGDRGLDTFLKGGHLKICHVWRLPLGATGIPLGSTGILLGSTGILLRSIGIPLGSIGIPFGFIGIPLGSVGGPIGVHWDPTGVRWDPLGVH